MQYRPRDEDSQLHWHLAIYSADACLGDGVPVLADRRAAGENRRVGILHVFDMDGTLMRGTTASVQVARMLGGVEDLIALEARFSAGVIDTRGFDV